MASIDLHKLVRTGNVAKLREVFAPPARVQEFDINEFDDGGYTPLMRAVIGADANLELVKLLLDNGADVHQESRAKYYPTSGVMAFALGGGNPEIIRLLLRHGADIHYQANNGYGAIVHAVHSRDIDRDEHLIELLKLLVENGVELNTVTSHSESGLRVLSNRGRFDAVKLLLDAGADPSQLKWTHLLSAVALGTLSEVMSEVSAGASIEDKDWWERTPWLLALQTGVVAKAAFLYEAGANTDARGRCGKPPLFYAIESGSIPMLRWLLEIGATVEDTNEFGQTPLMEAVENNNLEAVDELLRAGADSNREWNNQTALSSFQTREIGLRLLAAGADPRHLSYKGQRVLVGMNPDTSSTRLDIAPEDYSRGRIRRFGRANPEPFHDRFCESMIRAGISAYHASSEFEGKVEPATSPVWCANRFGQSITLLTDNRIIQIGGEHEDSYDTDFCIYNDVFVHNPDGAIDLFSYPQELFPPTDFHTASLSDQFIWIIGSLGYAGARLYGKTPVYRLNITSLQIEKIETTGENPGWIYKHTATPFSPHEVRISGGMVVTLASDKEAHTPNDKAFIFDTEQNHWRIVG